MSTDLQGLVDRILRLSPDQAFLVVAQLLAVKGKEQLAWAIAKRLCDEKEAADFLARARDRGLEHEDCRG